MQTIDEIINNLRKLGIQTTELSGDELLIVKPETIDMELAKRILPEDWFNELFVKEPPKPSVTYYNSPRIKKEA